MPIRPGRARLLASLLSLFLVVTLTPAAWAGHLGGRPENFQPDLATGRFTSSIPIAVPPGRRGLQPALALTYASGASGGLCGYGWTLEAAATEKSTRFGVVTNAANQGAYTFNLGGVASALVPINAEKTEWRAEAEGAFMRFTTPGWWAWEAWDRAGTHYVFDTRVADPHGRIYAYYLTRVQDLHGNTMTFTYDQDAYGFGQYLTQVDYTGHTSGLLPTNQVKLTWETRP
ncbi:MAG: hypothetical protein HY600_02015, partial [Candidatus Omnitrophica bacterium]|nr:hypothetical protein [Candidatus Omnitrophota bacterium]